MIEHLQMRLASTMLPLMAACVLAACGGGTTVVAEVPSATPQAVPLTVPKVVACDASDTPEAALQGQVPAAVRKSGFKGYNCNLSLVGQYQGEGGNWSSATFTDGAGRTCAYHSTPGQWTGNAAGTQFPTGFPTDAATVRTNPGAPVIDITDPTRPLRVTSLTSPAMMDSWESLRVSARRQILIADNGLNGGSNGGPEVDIYDLSGDCRSPQLMGSVAVGTGLNGGATTKTPVLGHEGNISPDGLTYYIGDIKASFYHAVDVANTSKPKLIASYDVGTNMPTGTRVHGLSVSNDGNRMYGVLIGATVPAGQVIPLANASNGFAIFDTSEVQARKAGATIKLISKAVYQDGSTAQLTIPVTISGKQYLVMVDEAGSAGLGTDVNAKVACAAGLSPFPMARIYDISDEKNPTPVSKMMLETHDPKNCAAVTPDIAGLAVFTYGSHYCSVDNRDNATALACSYFNSGVRVFDIRDPVRPKEIAYFNPPAVKTLPPSSNHYLYGGKSAVVGGPDWCASRLDFDFAKKRLTTMCHDNGLMVLQFAANTWPFAGSTASKSQN